MTHAGKYEGRIATRQARMTPLAGNGASEMEDPALLDRSAEVGPVPFTQDDDLLVEATKHQQTGAPFAGVVYAHQLRACSGQCVEDLELIASAAPAEDVANQVVFLPL
jgi:hypothetical protein